MTVSFQLFLTQENDSDIDSDFEDFDSDEESDSELVWQLYISFIFMLYSVKQDKPMFVHVDEHSLTTFHEK